MVITLHTGKTRHTHGTWDNMETNVRGKAELFSTGRGAARTESREVLFGCCFFWWLERKLMHIFKNDQSRLCGSARGLCTRLCAALRDAQRATRRAQNRTTFYSCGLNLPDCQNTTWVINDKLTNNSGTLACEKLVSKFYPNKLHNLPN